MTVQNNDAHDRFDATVPASDMPDNAADMLTQLVTLAMASGDEQLMLLADRLDAQGWSSVSIEDLQALFALFKTHAVPNEAVLVAHADTGVQPDGPADVGGGALDGLLLAQAAPGTPRPRGARPTTPPSGSNGGQPPMQGDAPELPQAITSPRNESDAPPHLPSLSNDMEGLLRAQALLHSFLSGFDLSSVDTRGIDPRVPASIEAVFRQLATHLAGGTPLINSGLLTPYVLQSVQTDGALFAPGEVPGAVTQGNLQDASSNGSVGWGQINVPTLPPAPPKSDVQPTPPENPTASTAYQLSITIEGDGFVPEGGELVFIITRDNTLGNDTVTYAIEGLTASQLESMGLTGSVTFAAGESSQVVRIKLNQDTTVGPDHPVSITVTPGPVGGGEPVSAVLTYRDDDDAPVAISAGVAEVTEGTAADPRWTEVTFTVTRTVPASHPADVPLPADSVAWSVDTTSTGAVSAADIHPSDLAGAVSFAEGELSKTITIRVLQDRVAEDDETLTVQLDTSASTTMTLASDADASASTTVLNDDVPTFSFAAAAQTVVEGNTLSFTVTRETGLGRAVSLNYNLLTVAGGGTPLADDDTGGTIEFAADETEKTITISTVNDQLVNGDQRFYLSLAPDAGIQVDGAPAVGIVTSDDAQISIDSIVAGSDVVNGMVTYTVTLSRTGALNFTHSVNWDVTGVGENPAPDSDFSLPGNRVITFPANNSGADIDTVTFTFQAQTGLKVNGERSFEVQLNESADNVVLGVDAMRANIIPTGVAVSIAPVAAQVIEGSAAGTEAGHTFRVSLSEAAVEDVVVRWTASSYGSGTTLDANAADFGGTFPTGTVTIPRGETSAIVTVTPSADSVVEASEKYQVTISVVSGSAGVVVPSATGTIINDDALVGFASATFENLEGNEGANGTLVAYVQREGFTRSAVSASWHVELINGQATQDDLVSATLPSGTIEMLPGQVQAEIRIPLLGDSVLENPEKFRIVLDNPGTGTTLKTGATVAEATILNDDAVIQMVSTTLTHAEGQAGETSVVTVEVSRTGDTSRAASFSWSAQHGTTSSTDFLGKLSGTASFAAGASTATFTIAVNPDDVKEADETFTVSLTGSSTAGHVIGAQASTVVTLTNDDAIVSFDTAAANLSQTKLEDGTAHAGQTFTYTIKRDGDISHASTVNWHLDFAGKTASSDDFNAVSGTATFAAGSDTATITVTPKVDKVVEADETFAVVLDAPNAGSGLRLGTTTTANGTLDDDDVAINATLVSAAKEGNSGVSTYTYTLTRTGDTDRQASNVDWTISGVDIVDGGKQLASALSAAELASVASGNVSWAAGATDSKTITVQVNADTVAEGEEAFRLNLTSGTGDHSNLLANGMTGVVHDDDAVLSISRTAASFVEGGAGQTQAITFTVTRTGDLSGAVSVDLLPSGSNNVTGPASATFAAYNDSVTLHYTDGRPDQVIQLTGGEESVDVQFTVTGDDTLESGEVLTVSLANPTGGATLDAAHNSATMTVTNDDDKVTVVASTTSLIEGNSGQTPLTFTLTRTGDTTKETAVAWRLAGAGTVPVTADDFVNSPEDVSVPNDGMPSGKVTFLAGETSKTVTVYVNGDTDIEADEGMTLDLSVAAGNTEVTSTTVTVVGDDVGYNAIARQATVIEGNDPDVARYVYFDLVRAGNTGVAKTVDWAVTGLTSADVLSPLSGSFTFAAGQTGGVVALLVKQDSVVDTNKTASLTLTDPANSNAVLATSGSTLLKDDDAAISISANVASVAEGTDPSPNVASTDGSDEYKEVSFTVTRTGSNLLQTSTANWSATGIDAADTFDGVTSGTVTFASGEVTQVITLKVKSDSIKENDETLTVSLTNASAGTSVTTASDHTVITNDDAEVAFDSGSLSLVRDEGDSGSNAYTFTLTRTGNLNQSSTVDWSVGGSEVNVDDFVGYFDVYGNRVMPYGTATFAEGVSTATVTVNVNPDTFSANHTYWWWNTTGSRLEGDERFSVTLSNPSVGTSIGTDNTAQGTIVNDDVKIQIVDVHTNLPEGLAPDANGDVNPSQAGIQTAIEQSFTLQRVGDPRQAITIEWYVNTSGFADQMQAGQATSGQITWAAGDTSPKTVTFRPVADDLIEPDYHFTVQVREVTGGNGNLIDEFSFGTNTSIVQNYNFPSEAGYITLGEFVVKRDEAGVWISNQVTSSYDSWSSLPQPPTEQYSGGDYSNAWSRYSAGTNGVNYSGEDAPNQEGSIGVAQAGSDFTAASGTVNFTQTNQTQHITLAIQDDSTFETTEGFSVYLDNATGATVVTDQGRVTIRDDDNVANGYRVDVQGSTAIEGLDNDAQFTVHLGKALTQENTFTVDLGGGSSSAAVSSTSGEAGDFTRYFEFSTDGGTTWQTNAPVFNFNVASTAKSVDDQMQAVYHFDNSNGCDDSFDSWLEFSDLKAGAGYKVGGVANADTLNSLWGGSRIYIAVKADTVVDPDALGLSFSGSKGALTGSFAGVADLHSTSDLNDDALSFFQNHVGSASNLSDIQSYFDQYAERNSDGQAVKFLVFDITVPDGQDPYAVDLIWSVDGLDASTVVAPQDGNVWSNLLVTHDLTLAAGDTSVNADVELGAQAIFDTSNVVDAVGTYEPNHLNPSFTLNSDTIDANGVRTVTVTVTRPDASVEDVLAYHLNIAELTDGAFLPGSATRDGQVAFEVGESTQQLTFTFSAIPPEPTVPVVQHDIHVVVDDDSSGVVRAYVDTDADGVLDASEAVSSNLAFDDGRDLVGLANNRVTIQFNDVPDQALNFQGFGADDKVEINLDQFGRNGWEIGQPQWGQQTGYSYNSAGRIYYAHSDLSQGGRTLNNGGYCLSLSAQRANCSSVAYLNLQGSNAESGWTNRWLATFGHYNDANTIIDGDGGLMNQVSFVHNPTVHVVIDGDGAYVDTDADGVHDASETSLAFSSTGADLIDVAHNNVVLHFNDAPDVALDLQGFGRDDRIEIDVADFRANGWDGFDGVGIGQTWQNQHIDCASTSRTSSKGLSLTTGYFSLHADRQTDGTGNRWSTNALAVHVGSANAELAKFGTGYDVNTIIDGNGALLSRVSFVNAGETTRDIHVVVDQSGAFIDTDADGVLDDSEAVDENRAFAADGTDLIHLSSNHVTIRVNDVPDVALDLKGFGADDKIEINLDQLSDGRADVATYEHGNAYFNAYSGDGHVYSAHSNWNACGSNFYFGMNVSRGDGWGGQVELRVQHSGSYGGDNGTLGVLGPDNDANTLMDGRGSLLGQISIVRDATIHVVVEADGAFIDTDADGVLDLEEATDANRAFDQDGSDLIGLSDHHVVVKFNDAPDSSLDFSGFGRDDRIEIDRTAFEAAGWPGGEANESYANHYRSWSGGYANSDRGFDVQSGSGYFEVNAYRYGSSAYLRVSGSQRSESGNYNCTDDSLAWMSGSNLLDGNGGLMNRVSFVQSNVVHVVVEATGGWIDQDADGVLDSAERTDANRAFDFAADGSNALVDLAHSKVVLHFNDNPNEALDLSGFGPDDRIEIDRTAMGLNGWHGGVNSNHWTGSDASSAGGFLHSIKYIQGFHSDYGCVELAVHGVRAGSEANLLGLSSQAGSGRQTAILGTFGDNTSVVDGQYSLAHKVSFVTSTIHVVVEADGAYIDNNGNGDLDADDVRSAFDQDTGAALIDLAHNKVVIEFNNAPNVALDFSGFGDDDRIEVDRTAFALNGWVGADNGARWQNAYGWPNSSGAYSRQYLSSYSDAYGCVGISVEGLRNSEFNELRVSAWTTSSGRQAVLADFGDNTLINGYGGLNDKVSFVGKTYIDGFDDGQGAITINQGGTLSGGNMSYTDTITVDAGVDTILIRTPIVDDKIDEAVETIGITVTHEGGDDFLVPEQSAQTVLVDNDSPQLTQASVSNVYDSTLGQYYFCQVIDINNRNGNTPNVYFSGNYYSNSLNADAGTNQSFTVKLTFSGAWEVALIGEELDARDAGSWGYSSLVLSSSDTLHNSSPAFTVMSGAAVLDEDGVPTGAFTYELRVPAGTEQILMRSAVSGYGANTDGLSMTHEVTHVDPVIVVRNTTVNEADGTVSVDVVAVGGDVSNSHPVSVDYETTDGQWVDRTFVISREYATAGEMTVSWSVQSLTASATATTGVLPDGNGYGDYVSGYFGQSVIGTVSPDDFVIVGDQSANALTGLPSGTVTFAEGQKEAYVTVRVRADNVGEAPEDFRVVLTEVPDGVALLANPVAPLSYAELGSAGYGKIVNDDQVFTVSGAVFSESISSKAVHDSDGWHTAGGNGMAVEGVPSGLSVPAGYTLHQFVINREGDNTAAASVDWVIQVKGVDGTGGFVETADLATQGEGAHQAETADFLSDGSAYGVTWAASAVGGVWSSLGKTVTFAAGESQKVVTVAIKDDLLAEDAEQFKIVLTNPKALEGNEGNPGVSETRGSADFLIGDDDGTTVSVAMGWRDNASASEVHALANGGNFSEGTGDEWTPSNNDTSNDRELVLTFTRSNADSTASQAFFELYSSAENNGTNVFSVVSGAMASYVGGASIWRGTVTFAEGETTATVVLRVTDDDLVENDHQITVTLYDAEHLPTAWNGGAQYQEWGGATQYDATGIGTAQNITDWNTTHRDAEHYTSTVTVKNDDVRLWVNGFTTVGYGGYNSGAMWSPSQSVSEGDSAWGGAADQTAEGASGGVTFTLARAGVQNTDITLGWEVVLNGTATLDDFNAAYLVNEGGVDKIKGTITLPADAVSGQEGTLQLTIANLFAKDRVVENNETFSLTFTSDETNVLFTPDWREEAPGSYVYHSDMAGRETMTIGMTLLNDDVTYGISLNAANASGKVVEGDSGNHTFVFDVNRAIDEGNTRTDGYTSGSAVEWRVVGIGDHPVDPATDFVGATSGTVYFNGSYQNYQGQWITPADQSDLIRQITLTIKSDSKVEYGENFRVELYNPSIGYVDPAHASATGTIVNDDTGILINDFSVREGDSGDTVVTATVTRVGVLDGDQSSMTWTQYNLDTDADDLGTGAFTGTLTMGDGGETSTLAQTDGYGEQTETFTFNVHGDATVEDDETMLLALSRLSGVDDAIDTQATVTVQNDDTVFSVVADPAFAANSYTEGAGTYHYLITRSNTTPQAQTVTWSVVSGGGRNLADASDFGGTFPSGTVTFQPGETSVAITVNASSADSTAEADERFLVQVTALGTGSENDTVSGVGAVGEIVNDDAAVFIGDGKPVTQIEGSGSAAKSYQFDVVRSGPIGGSSAVDWEIVLDGTATADDFTGPMSGTVNFSGNGTQTVSVGLVADSLMENGETFHIRLSNPTAGTTIVSSSNNAQGIIGDDDYTLSVANASLAEGDGNKNITFTVTRTGAADLAASVSWSLAFADGQADANDFRATTGTFTFPAGATTYTFNVPVKGDVQWEPNETFTVNLDYDRNNGTSGTTSAVGTLLNDDEGFSIAAIAPTLEGADATPGTITFRVVRDGNTTGDSSVTWSLAGTGTHAATTDDFASGAALTGQVEFADGETYKDVTVQLAGDGTAEYDEGFTVTLSNPGAGSSIKTATATGVITNDDLGYTVTADVTSLTEDDAAHNTITFTVHRSADPDTINNTESTVNWAIATASGASAALQAADFVGGENSVVTFAAGESSKTIVLQLANDGAQEGNATLRLQLSNPSVGSLLSDHVDAAVVDDDDTLALVAQQANSAAEGEPADAATKSFLFQVTRTGSSLGVAEVTWTVAGSGAHALSADEIDHIVVDGVTVSGLTGALSFADGDTNAKVIEVFTKTDDTGEFDEQFTVSLSDASYGSTLTTASATQTLLNDDPALQISMASRQIQEGNESDDRAFTFTVTRSGSTVGISTVKWAIESASANLNVEDFGGFFPSGLVTFADGESTKTVTVLTAGDGLAEGDEDFRIVLSAPTNGDIVGDASVTATLVNDDVRVDIAAVNDTLAEGAQGQTTRFGFELTASGSEAARTALVSWHVEGEGLHPANAADFVGDLLPSGSTTIKMAYGEGSKIFYVDLAGDNVYGPSEQFKVVIDSVDVLDASGNPLGGSAVNATAVVTADDDDTLIGLRQGDNHSVVEGNDGTTELRFYVDELGSSGISPVMDDIRVSYHITGDTNAADFVDVSGSNVALSSDDDGYYISVQVKGDMTVESSERFVLNLDSATSVSQGANVEVAEQGRSTDGVIVGDDFGLQFVASSLTQAENKARFVFDALRDGPIDQSMDVLVRVGVPSTLGANEDGASANDFIDPSTGLAYAAGSTIETTLHFDAGAATGRFVLEAVHDTTAENNERFAVTAEITQIGGADVTGTYAETYLEGLITNDDGAVNAATYHPDQPLPELTHIV
ncbi:Calx-beta domain-containing protein [Aquabacterium sp.]|uniref:Calx-beta domain-containing protein n=1 Tax=Aquabacterium sp. TaxID=1872578 RepID=UPI003B6CDA40